MRIYLHTSWILNSHKNKQQQTKNYLYKPHTHTPMHRTYTHTYARKDTETHVQRKMRQTNKCETERENGRKGKKQFTWLIFHTNKEFMCKCQAAVRTPHPFLHVYARICVCVYVCVSRSRQCPGHRLPSLSLHRWPGSWPRSWLKWGGKRDSTIWWMTAHINS